jgi:hypothetical protein
MSLRATASRVAGITGTLALVTGCLKAGGLTASPDSSSPGATPVAAVSSDIADDCACVGVTAEWAPYTVESLAAEGKGFVLGEVAAIQPAIFNTVDGKKPRAYLPARGSTTDPQATVQILTPVLVQSEQVTHGNARPGALRVVVLGAAPDLEVGRRYVFVLADTFDADGRKLPDLPMMRFAWPVDSNDVVITTSDGAMSVTDLARVVGQASPAGPVETPG